MKKFLFVVGFLVGMVGFGAITAESSGPKVPVFELHALDGKIYTDQHLIGQPTLLMFWASWCHVCQGEMPKVQALREAMKDKSFRILAIGFADPEANIRDYVAAHLTHFTFPVLYDTGDRVASRFGVRSTPTFFLLNKHGEVVIPYRGGGLVEQSEFLAILSKLLDEG